MFKLGDLEFEIKEAVFRGSFYDAAMSKRNYLKGVSELLWYIDINMESGKFITKLNEEELEEGEEPFYETVIPCLYHNNGFSIDTNLWKDIEKIVLNWDSEYNEKDEEAGNLYVFEHEEITKGKIEFLERRGDNFLIRWTGTANVYWNDEYGADVPFAFEGEVAFEGINAHCLTISTLEELKPAMMEFINLDEFECIAEESRKNGTSTDYTWKFKPNNID